MKLENRIILITGGTSGIGYELAKQLLRRGNTVIVTGRDQSRLDAARRALPGIHIFKSDVSDPRAISDLRDTVPSAVSGSRYARQQRRGHAQPEFHPRSRPERCDA